MEGLERVQIKQEGKCPAQIINLSSFSFLFEHYFQVHHIYEEKAPIHIFCFFHKIKC